MNLINRTKRLGLILFIFLTSFLLVSCFGANNIEEYVVVEYESNLMGGTTEKIIFGNNPAVYHYNTRKNVLQLQPKKIGNDIFNVNSSWDDVESIESIGMKTVYYITDEWDHWDERYKKINDNDIEVYKITRHIDFGTQIHISEMFVINIKDIEAFEFNYCKCQYEIRSECRCEFRSVFNP